MANLTITVDEETLKKARMNALAQNTSVNRILREYLESYAGVHPTQEAAVRRIIALSRKAESRRGDQPWNRNEIHERK